MTSRCLLLLVVVGIACTGCSARTAPPELALSSPAVCQVTQQPSLAFVPPAPYSERPPGSSSGEFWYGSTALWTRLDSAGTWSGLPLTDAGYGQKIFWWSQDLAVLDEPTPSLMVTGKRLDDGAVTLIASEATDVLGEIGPAMLVGVVIPTPGCWEITGSYRGSRLSFVVLVSP